MREQSIQAVFSGPATAWVRGYNNNMRNPIKYKFREGVTDVIIIACLNPLLCCVDALEASMQQSRGSLHFGTSITTFFIIFKLLKYFIKMLRDVGMLVPKIRETRTVYMQQDRG